jgi:Dolichyl-phosphate-mannose-protein mannosyltransferase
LGVAGDETRPYLSTVTDRAVNNPVGRAESTALLLAAGLSAVPLLSLYRTELIGYDAFWHVFVARQDVWSNFWQEVWFTAHPPFFYLCLRAAIALFGNNALAYRIVSILATVGSAWLVGRIVQRTASHRALPPLAACLFGLSLTTVSIGLDVRAYALVVVCLLWASLAYLDLVERAFSRPLRSARVQFGLMTTLALTTHYTAAFFLVAALATPVVMAIVNRDYRRRLLGGMRAYWMANTLTYGIPVAVLISAYFVQMRFSDQYTGHVPAFLFSGGSERAAAFVLRNTEALFELFLPTLTYEHPASTLVVRGPHLTTMTFGALLAFIAAAIAWLVFTLATKGDTRSIVSSVPLLLLLIMLVLLISAALLRRYPYGGELRHQFFLFPFVVIVLTLWIDSVHPWADRWRLGSVVVGLFALGIILNAVSWTAHFRTTRGYVLQPQMDTFRQLFPSPEAVYVDGFNTINLFTHHHDWHWKFVRQIGSENQDVWRVTNGTRGFYVCRDTQGLLDLSEDATYRRLAAFLSATNSEQVVVFRPQPGSVPAAWPVNQTATIAANGGTRAGLVPETIAVVGRDVYAAFGRSRQEGAVISSARPSGPGGRAGQIEVVQATYGSNCGVGLGNATRDVATVCNGTPSCVYQVDVRRLGDPAVGCAKQFVVEYRCTGEQLSGRVIVPAEAGLGGTAGLACQ